MNQRKALPGDVCELALGDGRFSCEDEAWPPPNKVVDPISGRIRIYQRGEIREAEDPVAATALEKAAVWDLHPIIERIRETLSS